MTRRGMGRDALEGKGPQRRPQRWFNRRSEEVAKAVGGGYCRLQMPLTLTLGVGQTVAGHRLSALEGGGGGTSPPFQCIPGHGPQCTRRIREGVTIPVRAGLVHTAPALRTASVTARATPLRCFGTLTRHRQHTRPKALEVRLQRCLRHRAWGTNRTGLEEWQKEGG